MFHHLARKLKPDTAQNYSDRQLRIHAFLESNPIGVLSTVTPNGDPHGVVIYFTVDKNFTISFLTKAGTRKHDNLNHHDHATLTVFEPQTQTTVQVTGRAVEVEDSYDVNGIAGKILAVSMKTSDVGMLPITKLQAGPYTAFTIKPTQVRMAVYARPDPGDYDTLFESIESFDLDDEDA